jgi:hypothetical protein
MWSSPDADLVALGTRELAKLGSKEAKVVDGTVIRQRAAYRVYDGDYRHAVDVIWEFIEREMPNLLVGRNGMRKYNNQDHAMMIGLMALATSWAPPTTSGGSIRTRNTWKEDGGAEQGACIVPRRVQEPEPHSSVSVESVPGH